MIYQMVLHRPVELAPVCRQNAECRRVGEEPRNIVQAADCRVIDDCVEIVEVKLILERVCVGEADSQQDARSPGLSPLRRRRYLRCQLCLHAPKVV